MGQTREKSVREYGTGYFYDCRGQDLMCDPDDKKAGRQDEVKITNIQLYTVQITEQSVQVTK